MILCPSSAYFDGVPNTDEGNERAVLSSSFKAVGPNGSGGSSIIGNGGGEKEIKLNVYLSATIHHNITINTPNGAGAILENLDNLANATTNDLVRRSLVNALNLTQPSTGSLLNTSVEPFENSQRSLILGTQRMEEINGSISNSSVVTDANYTVVYIDTSDLNTMECAHPEYIVFTWILCLVSLATALKLYYLVKVMMAICMVAFYTTLIQLVFPRIYTKELIELEQSRLGMPLGVQMLILLVSFLVMVCYHARLVEVSFLVSR